MTVVDSGNPQTLLWRALNHPKPQHLETEAAFKAVNSLDQVDYIWFLENYSLYHPCGEDEAIERIANELAELP